MFMLIPAAGVRYTKGAPKTFKRDDLPNLVMREFCENRSTHLFTRPPQLGAVVLKIGTLDDPKQFGSPKMALYTIDKQSFHQIAEGLPTVEPLPAR